MTRTSIQVERLIVHGHQTFYPKNTYKVDTDVAEGFVNEGYAIIVEDEPEAELVNSSEPETEVEKKKRQRKN